MFPILERSGSGKPGVGRAVASLICVAMAAGCSSSSSSLSSAPANSASSSGTAAAGGTTAAGGGTTAPPPAASTSVSPRVTGPLACAPSDLKVTLGVSQGYAGGVYEPIVFTNTSGSACSLYGYPGVSLVSAPPYMQIGLAAKRSGTVPVKLIVLTSGTSAYALLQVVDALNFGTASCSPTKAAFLRIYPPNQTVPVYLANTSEICAQPIQTLFISAVQPGTGNPS